MGVNRKASTLRGNAGVDMRRDEMLNRLDYKWAPVGLKGLVAVVVAENNTAPIIMVVFFNCKV